MRDPLVPPLAAVVLGILAGEWLTFSRFDAGWPLLAFALLFALTKTKWLRWTCAIMGLAFAGVFTQAWHRLGPRPEIEAGSRETVVLAGCVVEPSVLSPGREQFTLELAPGARARVSRFMEDGDLAQTLPYGTRVEIEARVREPRNFRNPGAFDYETYLARQKIFWTAAMRRNTAAKIMPGPCGSRALKILYSIRGAALQRIDRLYPDDNFSSGMLQAVLIGETSKLEKVWTVDFRRTGTFHALVISGTHVAVLAGVLLFLLRLCAMPEMPALTVTAAGAWLYALVSGFTPPVARAAGGFTLYLIARFFFRKGRVLNLLAAVAIVFLLWDPGELFDASFQLSFLSVAAIGAFAAPLSDSTFGPLARGLRGIAEAGADTNVDPHLEPKVAQFRVELRLFAETIHHWLRLPLSWCILLLSWPLRLFFFALEITLISVVIQIGLALPMAEYFHRISFTGLSANLLVGPLLEAVIPLGFLAIFTNWHWVAALSGWLLRIAARTAGWHARHEPNWRIADPPLWLALSLVAALLVFALVIANRGRRSRWLGWPAGLAVAGLFGLLLWQPWPARIAAKEMEVTSIDVGQGDSLLVLFPGGKRLVVDSGGVLQFGRVRRKPNLDTGEDVVSPYLWSRGITRLDVLVATHAHEDHTGGAIALLENFRPSELWVGANPPAALIARATQLGVNVLELRESPPFRYSETQVEILSPPEDYVAAKAGNNDSLALRIVYGANSFLLTGDMESPMEYRLLAEQRVVHSDVLKVGHHGSKTSTTEPFLDAVSPSVALISAGFENSFGHPHPSVVQRLIDHHVAILRTDLGGLATVRSDGTKLHFETSSWFPQHNDAAIDWAASANAAP